MQTTSSLRPVRRLTRHGLAPTALLVAPLTLSVVTLLAVSNSHAGEREGVSCPAGTPATLSTDTLSCKPTRVSTRASICPPLNFPNYTAIKAPDVDQCELQGAAINRKTSVSSIPAPVGGPPVGKCASAIPSDLSAALQVVGAALDAPPTGQFKRNLIAADFDSFSVEREVFVWPQGLPPTSYETPGTASMRLPLHAASRLHHGQFEWAALRQGSGAACCYLPLPRSRLPVVRWSLLAGVSAPPAGASKLPAAEHAAAAAETAAAETAAASTASAASAAALPR